MGNNRPWTLLITALAWMLLQIGPSAAAAQHENVMKVGKKSEVNFDTEMKVGDLTLKSGRYRLQHRVDGSDHFIHFEPLTGGGKSHSEVKCRLEPLSSKTRQTAVHSVKEDQGYRVTKVAIRGENVAHTF